MEPKNLWEIHASFHYEDHPFLRGYFGSLQKGLRDLVAENSGCFEEIVTYVPDLHTDYRGIVSLAAPINGDYVQFLDEFRGISRLLLSKEREILPYSVSCKEPEDYKVLDSILKEEHGSKAKVRRSYEQGFWGLLNNTRKVDYADSAQASL